MLPTKSHTCPTVHELISSLCAWHLRWPWFIGPGDDDALLCVRDGCGCGVVVVVVWCCWWLAGGEPTLRTGLGDSIFNRLLTGVDELKSNGDAALPRNWLFKCGWSLADKLVANGIRVRGDFCMYAKFDTVDWTACRFGDCCLRWFEFWLPDGELWRVVVMAFERFTGPFRICCSSASLAARACFFFFFFLKKEETRK